MKNMAIEDDRVAVRDLRPYRIYFGNVPMGEVMACTNPEAVLTALAKYRNREGGPPRIKDVKAHTDVKIKIRTV